MKKLGNLFIPLVFLIVMSSAVEAGWRAGTARVVITPADSMWMAGYAARNKPSEGKINDLYAKAVALEDDYGNRLVIINAEVVGIRRMDRDWLAAELQRRCGLHPAEFLVSVTHTHSGPEFRVDYPDYSVIPREQVGKSLAYRQLLRGALAEVAEMALADLEPASLSYSSGRAGFAMNRRLKTDEGYVIAPNRLGPVDHQVPVLKITGEENAVKALLFGYACHGTVLDAYQFCGDWPGFAQNRIEERFPGATAMFINGCSADQNPTPRRRLELARQFGESMANAVEAALLAQQDPVEGTLRVRLEEIAISFDNIPDSRELERMASSEDKYDVRRAGVLRSRVEKEGSLPTTYPYLIQMVEFGDSLLMPALSGEVVVDYSLRLKNEIKGRKVWPAAYCNDIMGYVPSRRIQEEGGYEAGEFVHYSTLPGTWGRDTEELIIGRVLEMAGNAGD